MSDLVQQMVAHAVDAYPNEACGLVVASGKRARLERARNLAANPRVHFDLDPDAWLAVGDDEEVVGIYHSHPMTGVEPSLADRASCEATGLPWHIVTPEGCYLTFAPEGFRAPYLKRPYVHGVHDCWSIARDWYNWEWGLGLADVAREDRWWEKGGNLYVDNFERFGFVRLLDQAPQLGDAFIMQVNSPVPNHAAIYLGDGTILHHVQGRLSSKDVYGGFWAKHTTHHVRHNSRLGTS